VLFDLDGTLLDTLRDIAEAMNSVLERLGHPAHPVEDYKRLTGDGVDALIESSFPPGAANPELIRDAVRMLREEYLLTWRRHTRPYPGIPGLLDALTERGVRMNILSNKSHEFTVKAADTFLGRWTFEQVIGARPDVARKPDPRGALRIARLSGLPASDFLYLGDTMTDMQTAAAAGMFPLGALWGFRTAEELWSHGAKAVAARPEEVLAFFDGLPGKE
ncbi:MAG: HAD family hydrolase, partial [Candidatus Aminicenantes bacterium]|nr:HAD family hydrolase [Candidatus Aminicenantes bacterium]